MTIYFQWKFSKKENNKTKNDIMNKIKIITEHFAKIDSMVNTWIASQDNIEIINATSSSIVNSNDNKFVTITIIYKELPLML